VVTHQHGSDGDDGNDKVSHRVPPNADNFGCVKVFQTLTGRVCCAMME
jgi:hypothetical protein